MDARNWDTALLCIFQYHIHNIAFFENFWVKKIFLVIFELYWTELEFWILTPKNEKKYFFRYPLPNILNFWKFLGQKIFFESFWSLMNWARIFKINTKKWKKIFLAFSPGPYYAAWPSHIPIFSHSRGETAASLVLSIKLIFEF